MCAGLGLRGRPVRVPDLDSPSKSVLLQLYLALQGGCPACITLTSESKCVRAFTYVCLLLLYLGGYGCRSLS